MSILSKLFHKERKVIEPLTDAQIGAAQRDLAENGVIYVDCGLHMRQILDATPFTTLATTRRKKGYRITEVPPGLKGRSATTVIIDEGVSKV